MNKFEARQRTAIDGRNWWAVFDLTKMQYSTLICFRKYKTKKVCQQAINFYQDKWGL